MDLTQPSTFSGQDQYCKRSLPSWDGIGRLRPKTEIRIIHSLHIYCCDLNYEVGKNEDYTFSI
jgi:hypothetical protein